MAQSEPIFHACAFISFVTDLVLLSIHRVEFLTHDISVHVPHHVNSKIPWYNLRKAHASLQKNWGEVSSST